MEVKKVDKQTDRHYNGLCVVSLCASRPFCLPSSVRPRGRLGDCSHGIPTLYERVSYSDWFSLPPAGACIRPVVIWIWISADAPCLSLLYAPQPVLSLLQHNPCLSYSLPTHRQFDRDRQRRGWRLRVISAMGDRSALCVDV